MSRYHHALAKFADKFDLEFMRRLDISQANDELLDEIDSYYREKTRNKGYTTTEEYREIYPLVAAIGNEQRKRFKESGEKMMAEAGLSYGDKVFYDHVHAFGAAEGEANHRHNHAGKEDCQLA